MGILNLMKDKLKLIKKDGSTFEDLISSVSSEMIIVITDDIVIEPGDLLLRIASNKAKETYEVIDPCFQEKFGRIPAQYTIKYKKLGVPEAKTAIQNVTYNLNGSNARVNNQSTDNSTNFVNINKDVSEHLVMLRAEIERLTSGNEKLEALEISDAIENQFKSESPSQAVVRTLISALPHAASIASIGAFLMTAIGG